VGFARHALQAAMQGDAALDAWMAQVEQELRVALFCTNSAGVSGLTPDKIERRKSP
jgi:isopentenyl diphosphate isomerase/L-lactate dehydrogenase-like FMN-dependent dehydrogenase